MSTPADYVTLLSRNGVKLWVDNGQLRYHAKKGVLGAEELARLRSMKSGIIAELNRAAVSAEDNSSRAPTGSVVEGPVSLQQQWLLKLLEEHPNWKATLSYPFHLKGALDLEALESSFEGILRAHASLRTRIVRAREQWLQRIEPSDGFQLPITQVSAETDADRQQSALDVVEGICGRELDPTVDPLITAQVVRVSAAEHFLVVLIHRLATDCLGIGHAFQDLWTSYRETTKKGSSARLEGSTQYRDYSSWQHTTDGAWRQKHAAYWNDYLAGAECLRLPDREHAALAASSAAGQLTSLESPFGKALSDGLRELSRATQTLPALIMLTVYVAGVSIWCHRRDLVIPFVIAGRGAAHERVVGCFSHVAYLRIRLHGSESFVELLKLVSNEFYRAAAFRQDSGRTATHRPELLGSTLCQWLSWHPADIAQPQRDDETRQLGIEVEMMRCRSTEELTNVPPDRVDLEITFFDAAGDISALAIYRADRFAEGAPARMMRELRSIAQHAIEDSNVPFWGLGKA